MSALDLIMRQPLVYRLWMAPFAEKKFAPIAANNAIGKVRRVLDVGCGPGTNADYFPNAEYLGVDLNERYIRDAEGRQAASNGKKRFVLADAAKFSVAPGEKFDFILVNSFLHHVDDSTARSILANLTKLLTEDGHLHCLELVLPDGVSAAKFMARADRGKFARPLDKWRELFGESSEGVLFQLYELGVAQITLWKMVYFKGRAKS
jgi:SAM-dependent methyltransferase